MSLSMTGMLRSGVISLHRYAVQEFGVPFMGAPSLLVVHAFSVFFLLFLFISSIPKGTISALHFLIVYYFSAASEFPDGYFEP